MHSAREEESEHESVCNRVLGHWKCGGGIVACAADGVALHDGGARAAPSIEPDADACDDECPHVEACTLWAEVSAVLGPRANELTFLRSRALDAPASSDHLKVPAKTILQKAQPRRIRGPASVASARRQSSIIRGFGGAVADGAGGALSYVGDRRGRSVRSGAPTGGVRRKRASHK